MEGADRPFFGCDGTCLYFLVRNSRSLLGIKALLAGLFPSLPYTLASLFVPHLSSPYPITSSHSFLPDIYRNHREAVSALSQVRQETRQVGVERRDGVRRRVKEMRVESKDEK